MEAFLNYTLFGHVICGFTSLVMGLAVIFAKKHGKIHRTLGGIYFWAMTGVFITSMFLSILKYNPFLFGVGIFSYYLVFTGFRFGKLKEYHNHTAVDKWVSIVTLICSIGMLVFSAYVYFILGSSFIIVLAIFGSLSLAQSIQDLRNYGKKLDKHNWLMQHIKRMLGGYLATVTAFLLTAMGGMLPPLVLWLGPGLIGGFGIAFTIRHYKKKLGIKPKKSNLKAA